MSSIPAGSLKRPVTISAPSTSPDSFGQAQSTWTSVLSTWSSIRAVTSKEVYALGSGFTSQVTHGITIRFNPNVTVTAGMRVSYMTRTFLVQAVSDPDEERVLLNLMCLEETK